MEGIWFSHMTATLIPYGSYMAVPYSCHIGTVL